MKEEHHLVLAHPKRKQNGKKRKKSEKNIAKPNQKKGKENKRAKRKQKRKQQSKKKNYSCKSLRSGLPFSIKFPISLVSPSSFYVVEKS